VDSHKQAVAAPSTRRVGEHNAGLSFSLIRGRSDTSGDGRREEETQLTTRWRIRTNA
jgi:hypothetical protein